jgi:mannose-6-phosphate isomerase-like protein (cupin superfamily)
VDELQLGPITVRYVHAGPDEPYALLEWVAPPRAPAPPVHVHHRTDEGFYVLGGTFAFQLDGERIDAPKGSHVLVRRGHPHTFWNAGAEIASCLIVLSPAGFAEYFRELAEGLERAGPEGDALALRVRLSATHDIEVVEPVVPHAG